MRKLEIELLDWSSKKNCGRRCKPDSLAGEHVLMEAKPRNGQVALNSSAR